MFHAQIEFPVTRGTQRLNCSMRGSMQSYMEPITGIRQRTYPQTDDSNSAAEPVAVTGAWVTHNRVYS